MRGSHSVLRYVACLYFGFSVLMDYVHVLAISDVVKLFVRKLIIIIIIITGQQHIKQLQTTTILGTAYILYFGRYWTTKPT